MLGFCDEASFRRLITQGSPFSMVYQEDIPEFQNKLDIIIKGADGACSEFEHRLCTLGGGTRWSHTVCQKIRIGNDEYIHGVFNDVTERHDTELLKYGKSLLRYFNEVFEVDFNTMTFKPISDGENAKASIHGEIALEKLLSERIMTVASQDERDSLERRFRYIQEYLPESVDDLPPLDYSVINENGERLFHSLMLINTDRGRYLCCIKDISALKKAEKLSVEEARLTVENNERKTDEIKNRFVLETLCISVIDYDIPGDIITYCSYRGKNPVNARKAHFYENMSANISFVHPDDREALISVFTRASGTPLKGELIVRIFNNGGYSGNLMNYMSFADENGKMRHLLGMFTELESGKISKRFPRIRYTGQNI